MSQLKLFVAIAGAGFLASFVSTPARSAVPVDQIKHSTAPYVSDVPATPWWAHRHLDQACVPAREAVHYPSPAEHLEAMQSQSPADRAAIKENGEDEVDVIVVQLRGRSYIYANNNGDRQGSTSALVPTSETFRYFRTKEACDAERHALDSYR
jgi:hypothetical protein